MKTPRFFRMAGVRLTSLAAGIFLVCMIAVAIFIYLSVREQIEDQLRDQVAAETRQLLGDYRDDGLDELRHDIHERLERNPGTRLRYTLQNANGVSLFDRLSLPQMSGWSRLESDDDTRLILLTTQLEDGYRLGVGADMRSISETAAAFRHAFVIVVIPMILLAILSGAVVSRRFLSRVERLKQTADSIGESTLSARMEVSGSGDDFDGLVLTINRMLDRIEGLVHDVRHVTTNIAHDLRSPLGRLRQRLEYLQAHQTSDAMRDRTSDAIAILDETLDTFSAMLKIAELETGVIQISQQLVNFPGLLADIADIYRPVAETRDGEVIIEHDGLVEVPGDRALLVQLVVNLVENSLRHNDGRVLISLSCGWVGNQPFIRIRDNGQGIPDHQLKYALKPFRRLDSARSTTGSGLGLSLAASIAARHGADIVLENASPGLSVTVLFRDPTYKRDAS